MSPFTNWPQCQHFWLSGGECLYCDAHQRDQASSPPRASKKEVTLGEHFGPLYTAPHPTPAPPSPPRAEEATLTRADIATNMQRLRAEGSAGGGPDNYVTWDDEKPRGEAAAEVGGGGGGDEVRQRVRAAIRDAFGYDDTLAWTTRAADAAIAAMPRLSAGSRAIIESGLKLAEQAAILKVDYDAVSVARAELERLP